MVKEVTYTPNFDSRPQLRDRLERLLPVIESELGTAVDRVSLHWTLRDGGADPLLTLVMVDEWAGENHETFMSSELEKDDFRVRIRGMHDFLLARYLRMLTAVFRRRETEQPVGG